MRGASLVQVCDGLYSMNRQRSCDGDCHVCVDRRTAAGHVRRVPASRVQLGWQLDWVTRDTQRVQLSSLVWAAEGNSGARVECERQALPLDLRLHVRSGKGRRPCNTVVERRLH